MRAPVLLDLSHTSHTRARTGIQRVARSLYRTLGAQAAAITFDPHQAAWRTLAPWEIANLQATAPARKRGAKWPLLARLRGRWRRASVDTAGTLPASSGLIVPELFSTSVAAALPTLLRTVAGPRVAVFHDAIALKFPELTPTKTVARFPGYLQELLRFDGIAAISEESRATLADYWAWLGVHDAPPIVTIPLALDVPAGAPAPAASGVSTPSTPVLLSVGSIEGRKNHAALLEASEALWAAGHKFSLRLIGLANAETGRPVLEQIARLQASGRSLRYDGAVDEPTIEQAYRECTFTVYPSLMEGFGLPVLESLAHGKPCVCLGRGALGESARGGGCLTVDEVGAASLQTAIDSLLADPSRVAGLSAAARARTFRTWDQYGADLQAWMATLPRRNPAI